jgi:hypothetical protein
MAGLSDAGTRRRGDAETRRPADAATGRRGDGATRRRGDGAASAAALLRQATVSPRLRVGHLALLELAVLALIVAIAFRLRMANLEHYSGSFDEGVRMGQLLLMEHGYRPYRDIFASQGPLLLDLLYPFYMGFGQSLGAARLGVGLLSLAGLLGAWWTARAVSPLAGVGAAVLLALSPAYLENSRLALAEVPSLAPCLWAIGCALRWRRGGSGVWLYGAMVLATVGVLIKPMVLPVMAPLALLVLLRPHRRVQAVTGAVLLAVALSVLLLIALDPGRVFEVLGSYRLGAQRGAFSSAAENIGLTFRTLLREQIGFSALAVMGSLIGLAWWRTATLALMAWPLAQLALFVGYTDLSDKHVVYLVPPLAMLGGFGIAGLGPVLSRTTALHGRDRGNAAWRGVGPAPSRSWMLAALISLTAVAVYVVTVPALWRTDRELRTDADERVRRDYAGTQEQAALMAVIAGPTEFVLTDNPNAAFFARRLVPPWLVDTSGTRIDAGSLTSEVAIREASRYEPKVVITWRRRLGKLDDFTRWLETDYRLIKTYPGSDPTMPLQLYVQADREERARSYLAGS